MTEPAAAPTEREQLTVCNDNCDMATSARYPRDTLAVQSATNPLRLHAADPVAVTTLPIRAASKRVQRPALGPDSCVLLTTRGADDVLTDKISTYLTGFERVGKRLQA